MGREVEWRRNLEFRSWKHSHGVHTLLIREEFWLRDTWEMDIEMCKNKRVLRETMFQLWQETKGTKEVWARSA